MNPSSLLNNSKPFVLLSVFLIVGILFFSPLATSSGGDQVYSISALDLTITNNSGKSINHLCISSNYESSIGEINGLAAGESVTIELKLPYLGEGSAILCFMDNDGIVHQESIVGYLMPSHKVQVIVHQADSYGLVITVREVD